MGKALPESATRNNARGPRSGGNKLDLAGIEVPESMQGRSLFDAEAERTFPYQLEIAATKPWITFEASVAQVQIHS